MDGVVVPGDPGALAVGGVVNDGEGTADLFELNGSVVAVGFPVGQHFSVWWIVFSV